MPFWWIPLSILLSLLDWLYVLARKLRPNPKRKFFARGFGDMHELERCVAWATSALEPGTALPPFAPTLVKGALKVDKSGWGTFPLEVYEFLSPVADFLPTESRTGLAQILLPAKGPPIGVAVHLAATGDQGFTFRKALMARALARAGIASVIIQIPPYGRRRVLHQVAHYSLDVSTLLRCSQGCMWEGQAWARWAADRWNVPVVLTGISYGGAMCLGALILAAGKDYEANGKLTMQYTAVSHVGSESPCALLTGLLRDEIDWAALDSDLPKQVATHPQWKGLTTKEVLRQCFEACRLGEDIPQALVGPQLQVHLTAAAHDGFVVPAESAALYATLQRLNADVSLEWVPGGHVSAIAMSRFFAVPRVIEAVQRLAAERKRQ